MPRTLYLDTFATVRVASDPEKAASARDYIKSAGFELVVGAINLLEIFAWPKRRSEVLDFLSSVPFSIAQNPEDVAATEVACYPNPVNELPVAFRSLDHLSSQAELREALEVNLMGKIAAYRRNFEGVYDLVWKDILARRASFLPEKAGKYSPLERHTFLQINVLQLLYPDHRKFLQGILDSGEAIKIELFKSVYIQCLAIFLEYYVQKKEGKASDVGDIYQLGLIPYIDMAVVDNERHNLVQRINRDKLFPVALPTCNLAEFYGMIGQV
jgi:hypothetical protein